MARVGNSRVRARVPPVCAPRLSGGSTDATPRLSTMPFCRLAARLAQMLLRPIWSSARGSRRVAPFVPLPDEIVERVLLSPDLVPRILGPLGAEDGAAAAVCSQWLAGWKETNEPRRRLKEVPLDLPEELCTAGDPLCGWRVAATLDGRLVASAFTERKAHILDRNMRVVQLVTRHRGPDSGTFKNVVAADDHSVYYIAGSYRGADDASALMLHRASLDGTSAAEYQFHDGHRFVSLPVLASGLLFCAMTNFLRNGGDGQIEIFAVDVQTMQLRHRFGGGLLGHKFYLAAECVLRLAVGGDELYASVADQDCLQVFSLTGVHRRSARGEWRAPGLLCCAKDRVYLVASRNADDDGCGARSLLVLSKQGDILQVYTHWLRSRSFDSIIPFDGKLLVKYGYYETPSKLRRFLAEARGVDVFELNRLSLRRGAFALQHL